jgi:hypothetical protein
MPIRARARDIGPAPFAKALGKSVFCGPTVLVQRSFSPFAGLVAMAGCPNPIPSRTRSLNASAPMVLCLKTWESRSLPGLPKAKRSFLHNDHKAHATSPVAWAFFVRQSALGSRQVGSRQSAVGMPLTRCFAPSRRCRGARENEASAGGEKGVRRATRERIANSE